MPGGLRALGKTTDCDITTSPDGEPAAATDFAVNAYILVRAERGTPQACF